MFDRIIAWVSGFFENTADQSMTRLIAIMFAVVGSLIGLVGAAIALIVVIVSLRHGFDLKAIKDALDGVRGLIGVLAVLAGVFVANGAVAIALRKKPDGAPVERDAENG